MLFHISLTHSPEHCWARPENDQKARDWISGLEQRASEFGVAVKGAFVNSNEHTFYILLEADDYANVSGFLGPPLLTDHEADVTPVVTIEQAARTLLDADGSE